MSDYQRPKSRGEAKRMLRNLMSAAGFPSDYVDRVVETGAITVRGESFNVYEEMGLPPEHLSTDYGLWQITPNKRRV